MNKKYILMSIYILFCFTLVGQNQQVEEKATLEILDSLIGGFIGGILGVIGTILSSYYGPRKLEMWKQKQKELKQDGPRKKLLKQMLEDKQFSTGRKLSTLSRVTGTSYEECRRLLIEIGARGLTFKNEPEHDSEGWALIEKAPLNEK